MHSANNLSKTSKTNTNHSLVIDTRVVGLPKCWKNFVQANSTFFGGSEIENAELIKVILKHEYSCELFTEEFPEENYMSVKVLRLEFPSEKEYAWFRLRWE